MPRLHLPVVGVVVLVALGCVDQGPGPKGKKIDPTYVQSHLLAVPPPDLTKFDTPLEDKVIYLGNKLGHPKIAPGATTTITHYWRVVKPLRGRYKVFTLVRGPANTADFINVPPSDMQLAHGPETWQVGEIIEDIQPIVMRPDWSSPTATVLVGLIETGEHGTLDRMEATGPRTQDRAIVAAQLEVDLSRAPPKKGTIHVARARGAITIDGVGNDPGWTGTTATELVVAEGSGDPAGKASAKLTWDDQFLYAFVTITDSDITSPFKQQDDPLWKGDCVELFIDADGNRRGYVELQVSPRNITFDSWFQTTRAQPGNEAWDSSMATAVRLRGTAEPGDTDTGWDVEIGIPWAAVKGLDDGMKVRLPPQVGDSFRLNLVRVDRKTGNDKAVFAASWNKITMSDFHALDRMLVAVFADATGSITPGAPLPPDQGSAAGSGSAVQAATGSGSAAPAATGSGSAVGLAPARFQVGSGSAAIDPAQPGGSAAPAQRRSALSFVVDVPAQGDAIVNNQPMKDAELAKWFGQLAAQDKTRTAQVAFRAAKGTPHARVVQLMELAKQAGLTRLAIATAP